MKFTSKPQNKDYILLWDANIGHDGVVEREIPNIYLSLDKWNLFETGYNQNASKELEFSDQQKEFIRQLKPYKRSLKIYYMLKKIISTGRNASPYDVFTDFEAFARIFSINIERDEDEGIIEEEESTLSPTEIEDIMGEEIVLIGDPSSESEGDWSEVEGEDVLEVYGETPEIVSHPHYPEEDDNFSSPLFENPTHPIMNQQGDNTRGFNQQCGGSVPHSTPKGHANEELLNTFGGFGQGLNILPVSNQTIPLVMDIKDLNHFITTCLNDEKILLNYLETWGGY